MKRLMPILLAFLAAACGPKPEPPLQGYVEGEYVRVAAPFAGTLVKLDVRRGQQVASGAPLFALEAENEDAARREAEERVRRAEAQVEDLRKGKRQSEIESAHAQLAQAEAASAFSQKEFIRQEDLLAKGFVSRSRVDEARAQRDRDRSRVAELQADLTTARSGSRPDEIRAAQAEAQAAKAALAQADWRLRQKTVASTVSGIVNDTLFVQGEWVPSGTAVVSLLPPTNVKIRFFVSQTKLGAVKLGQKVDVTCDACGASIAANVTFIAPQAEYTPPVIYSQENRAKLVFLVEARPSEADAVKLHPGQPVDVRLP